MGEILIEPTLPLYHEVSKMPFKSRNGWYLEKIPEDVSLKIHQLYDHQIVLLQSFPKDDLVMRF
jgi:hypothetical protein